MPSLGSDQTRVVVLQVRRSVAGARPAIPNLAGGAGGGTLPASKDGKDGQQDNGQPGVTNNVTINQASAQPANDMTHALNVMHQNNPAMGR